jgi:Domain of unknown function (DUF4926)
MRKRKIKLAEPVALVEDLPERKLRAGEVGTVVELLRNNAYEPRVRIAFGLFFSGHGTRHQRGEVLPRRHATGNVLGLRGLTTFCFTWSKRLCLASPRNGAKKGSGLFPRDQGC